MVNMERPKKERFRAKIAEILSYHPMWYWITRLVLTGDRQLVIGKPPRLKMYSCTEGSADDGGSLTLSGKR